MTVPHTTLTSSAAGAGRTGAMRKETSPWEAWRSRFLCDVQPAKSDRDRVDSRPVHLSLHSAPLSSSPLSIVHLASRHSSSAPAILSLTGVRFHCSPAHSTGVATDRCFHPPLHFRFVVVYISFRISCRLLSFSLSSSSPWCAHSFDPNQ